MIEYMSVESSFIRGVVEDLQKLTPPKMEHELRIQGEVLLQPKRRRVVLPVFRKPGAKTDEHSVYPTKHIRSVVNLRSEDGNTGHQYRCSFLVERLRYGRIASWSAKISGHCGHP